MKIELAWNSESQGQIKPIWRLITAGRAQEGLRSAWRKQLDILTKEMQVDYIRFHGIYNDEMMIYNEDAEGKPFYNFQYFDELFDYLTEKKIHPIFEVSFTPTLLKSNEATVFWWRGNISPPRDYEKYAQMVKATILHAADRYGWEEVEQWKFEIWNEPSLYTLFWKGNFEQYMALYEILSKTIKSVSEKLMVGGPSSPGYEQGKAPWLEEFLAECERRKLPVDFISAHPYPTDFPADTDGNTKMIYSDPERSIRDILYAKHCLEKSAYPNAEIHLTEWNSSPSPRDLVHDTAFMAPFIIDNNIKAMRLTDTLGFWTFTDVFEENAAGTSMFHGGFGMFNYQGIKKPSYYAYLFLHRLKGEIRGQGDNYIFTDDGETLRLLVWNYCHYTPEMQNATKAVISPNNRYDGVFKEKSLNEEICVKLQKATYKITVFSLSRENGSAYDLWQKNGALENLTKEEVEWLKHSSEPARTIQVRDCDEYRTSLELPPHGVWLAEFRKIKQI